MVSIEFGESIIHTRGDVSLTLSTKVRFYNYLKDYSWLSWYRKLGSIVIGHSIQKLRIFCASKFMGDCIHGVNYDAVKNTVAVYRV